MERLKAIGGMCQPDSRWGAFSKFDPSAAGAFRERAFEDFHAIVRKIELSSSVPDPVRSHFETARNLGLYSWFFYPFNVTAQLCGYISVEFALRTKTGDRDTHFQTLLKRAVDAGWITDAGFSLPRNRLARTQERNAELPPELRIPEPSLLRDYSDAIVRSIPYLRNRLAHGSQMLHHTGLSDLQIAAEIINQIFAAPPGDLSPPALVMNTHERALQIYQILIGSARNRQILTYDLLGKMIGVPAQGLAGHLGHIMRYCAGKGLPPLTVLVVRKDTGKPGDGFTTFEELHKDRERVFAHDWYRQKPITVDDLKPAN